MKFDNRKDHAVLPETTKSCYLHKNKFVEKPDEKQDDGSKDAKKSPEGRTKSFWVNAFLTPVLSSERITDKGGRCLVDGVDELSKALENLMIGEDDEKATPKEESKKMIASTKKLILETPEARDPALGLCRQAMVDPTTNKVVEVIRSMRLVKGN